MTETMVKSYQNRIVNAGKADLLVINYELLIIAIDEAIIAVDEDINEFSKVIIRAQKLLRELTDNLDFKYDISRDLMAIYIYVNKQFVESTIHFSKEPLINAKEILLILFKGWIEIQKGNKYTPIISNGQQLYAGLTYGRGTLNEMVYQGSNNRGYKA